MRRLNCAFLVLIFLVHRLEGKLPDFIKLCHFSDTELGKCIFQSAKLAIPEIVKGVKELDIPPLTKVKLPTIKTADSETFSLTFDGDLEGLETANYTALDLDRVKKQGVVKVNFPELKLIGKYKISGKVGDVPVAGDDVGTITLDDATYAFGYSLVTYEKSGTPYYKAENPVINSIEVKGESYQFDNLSSGDKTKGKEANDLLITKKELLKKTLDPLIAEKIVKLAFDVANKFIESVPAREIFLP